MRKNKGWLIGGIIGLLLFLYFNNFCIRYAIREDIILSSFFTSFSPGGSNCVAITLKRVIFNAILWIFVPASLGALFNILVSKFKK